MHPFAFTGIEAAAPTLAEVTAHYEQFDRRWRTASSTAERRQIIADWDTYLRELETWINLTDLHFQQDTSDAEYKQRREYLDELRPQLTELEVNMKRQILSAPDRADLEQRFGGQALALWEADVICFDPRIKDDLVQEAKLCAEYTDLLATAELSYQGNTYNFAGLAAFHTDADRQVRYDSNHVRWSWFAAHRDKLDDIFARLVELRHGMAKKLSLDDFVSLGYQKMKRIDYDQQDVERFRQGVRRHVVPLAQQLRSEQAQRLAIDRVMFWDEGVFEAGGNPRPRGDHDWMIARAQEMFDAMGQGLGEFFHLMVDSDLMDLRNRDHKAGGGFCTDFPSHGLPFIFANFNGTKGDVQVFTHEIGHAFQCYSSRHHPLKDYLFPTCEACEVHSMGLEFLTWPQMEKFFGEDAERFRRIHLIESLLFLPYGVAVDHFQHLIYAAPEATAAERHSMWQEMERMYLPWRDAGGLPHVAQGGQWQLQRHIYLIPFYYIDYTLALTCALQLWVRSQQEPSATMEAYAQLCNRGGSAPFGELIRSAGLASPFNEDCLEQVVAIARN